VTAQRKHLKTGSNKGKKWSRPLTTSERDSQKGPLSQKAKHPQTSKEPSLVSGAIIVSPKGKAREQGRKISLGQKKQRKKTTVIRAWFPKERGASEKVAEGHSLQKMAKAQRNQNTKEEGGEKERDY